MWEKICVSPVQKFFSLVGQSMGPVNMFERHERFTASLCGLEETAQYRFTDAVSGTSFILSGKEAAAGITAEIEPRSAVLYFYEKL